MYVTFKCGLFYFRNRFMKPDIFLARVWRDPYEIRDF